ncbi:TIGR03560 family F420-dependent LLM class oxidoreductase [Nonomuraea sp. NPDC050394]|uniref:TIGR03560 family F420-dependent LLM class oxidoreductase n=1 Tax=Nonomuraea sp. NPDC050394 TaxID=3364363 RepID=UPI00379680AD
MRVSIGLTNYSWPEGPGRLADVAKAADDGGVDTLWVPDHLLQADPTATPDQREMYEAYTTLGYLAAHTGRVRLGTMVTAVTFREPALLVKAVTTVHALSGGRAWLGIGAGYHEEEAHAMGVPLPPVAERFDRLEETLRIARHMWSGDESPYEGTHYHLARPTSHPRPETRPRVLIGGTGERRTLPLVARYADACNVFDIPDDGHTVRRKLSVLARECEKIARPYEEIEKTLSTRLNPGESATSFTRRCEQAAAWGIDHAVVITAGPWTPANLKTLTTAVRQLR